MEVWDTLFCSLNRLRTHEGAMPRQRWSCSTCSGTLHQLPGADPRPRGPQRTGRPASVWARPTWLRSRGLRGWRAALALAAMGFAAMGTHGAVCLMLNSALPAKLNKAYDKAFAEHWEAQGLLCALVLQDLAWRLRQAGALGDRRAGRRRS